MSKNKAVSFLERHSYLFNQCEAGIITIQEFYNLMQDAGGFFSQPFSADLIEKYFEGIKHSRRELNAPLPICDSYFDGNSPFDYDKNKFRIQVCSADWHNTKMIEYYNYKVKAIEYLLPLTLDQFISDCIRAGIDLTFNATALKELSL